MISLPSLRNYLFQVSSLCHFLLLHSKTMFGTGKIQQILCTGNVCDRETYEWLRTVAVGGDVAVVRGDYDEVSAMHSALAAHTTWYPYLIPTPCICILVLPSLLSHMATRLTAVFLLAHLLQSPAFPLSHTVTHQGSPIRIGVIHGHQCVALIPTLTRCYIYCHRCIPAGDLDSLNAIARQMDVDVLVSGHTHT